MVRTTSSALSLLSDHMPFIAKGKEVTLMGWNILCKMQFNQKWKYFNNGFKCTLESDEDYSNRLGHIAAQIRHVTNNEKPDFICLQECPETIAFRTQFETEIGSKELADYEIKYFNNDKDEYYLITLYNSLTHALLPTLSDEINRVALNQGLAGRVLPLVFMNKKLKETILVINVHANFSKEVQSDVKVLYQRAIELGINKVIMLGDFNRDLVLESDNYSQHDISKALDVGGYFAKNLQVHAIRGSSFMAKYQEETLTTNQIIETRDGIMSSFPVNVACLTDVNSAHPTLALDKTISPCLSSIPAGFLAQLADENHDKSSTPQGLISAGFFMQIMNSDLAKKLGKPLFAACIVALTIGLICAPPVAISTVAKLSVMAIGGTAALLALGLFSPRSIFTKKDLPEESTYCHNKGNS